MSDDSALSDMARKAIRDCRLPDRRPDRAWGGPGGGTDCTICGAPLRQDEIELEIEFLRGDDSSGVDKYYLHAHCFGAWEMERLTRAPAQEVDGSVSIPTGGSLPDPIEGPMILGRGRAAHKTGTG